MENNPNESVLAQTDATQKVLEKSNFDVTNDSMDFLNEDFFDEHPSLPAIIAPSQSSALTVATGYEDNQHSGNTVPDPVPNNV